MLFNSSEFFVFFFVVYLLYWLLPRRAQNVFLLLASYLFYGWLNFGFLAILLLTTLIDYFSGWAISSDERLARKKLYLILSVVCNLGLLLSFKYTDFFLTTLNQLSEMAGRPTNIALLNLAVPIGISFYTFHSLSYTIDVYLGKAKATKNLLDFALFVTFFPQLVAGPIERSAHLLPQIQKPRQATTEDFWEGAALAALGFFKKVVIADNLSLAIDPVFASIATASPLEILAASVLFAFQIYFDFAGYSDIAIGVARMLGFRLNLNFNRPYFSRTPAEFWTRWHISLSSRFQEYVFTPLALVSLRKGNSLWNKYRAYIVTMVFMGMWHGANIKFLVFGLFWAAVLITYNVYRESFARLPDAAATLITFALTCVGWLFFRIEYITQLEYLVRNPWQWSGVLTSSYELKVGIACAILFMGFEIVQHLREAKPVQIVWPRALIRLALVTALTAFGFSLKAPVQAQFFYFKF